MTTEKLPLVGYIGDLCSEFAAFRLRVDIPSHHMNLPYIYGNRGDITFIYRHLVKLDWVNDMRKGNKLVYDISNNHFDNKHSDEIKKICEIASAITCSSDTLAETIKEHTGRTAVVIPDPYETIEREPTLNGDKILWFGHFANLNSLYPYRHVPNLTICSRGMANVVPWTIEKEEELLNSRDLVLLTTDNLYASENRIIKSLRAGKFVITPNTDVISWTKLKDFIWQGDVYRGIKWALNNREEAKNKIAQGQKYINEHYHPEKIGHLWRKVFIDTHNQ